MQTEKMILEQNLGGGRAVHLKVIYKKIILGSGESQSKGPRVIAYLVYWMSSTESIVATTE
jgi:hypothetical protein